MSVVAEKLSAADLVDAASSLAEGELEQLVRQLLALRAQRRTAGLPAAETELLLEINRGLSAEQRQRFHELGQRRQAGSLTPAEQAELSLLAEEVERLDGQRLQALVKLAQVRGKPLAVLMDELGIRPPPVAGLA